MPARRKTAAEHRVSGTFRADRHGSPAWEPLTRSPQVPADMDPQARKFWRELAPMLVSSGVLTPHDLPALRLLCDSLALEGSARRLVAAEGITCNTPQGPKSHPAVRIMMQARSEAARLLAAFGMTPRDRRNVEPVAPQTDEDDPAEAFFADQPRVNHDWFRPGGNA